jgi:hypothetical protein
MTEHDDRAGTGTGFSAATSGSSGSPASFTAPLDDRPGAEVDAASSNAAMAAKILSMPVQPHSEDGYVVRVLEVRGRRSGTLHRVPIAVVRFGGALCVVSPRADRAWARKPGRG